MLLQHFVELPRLLGGGKDRSIRRAHARKSGRTPAKGLPWTLSAHEAALRAAE
jgi:hypothetical protein